MFKVPPPNLATHTSPQRLPDRGGNAAVAPDLLVEKETGSGCDREQTGGLSGWAEGSAQSCLLGLLSTGPSRLSAAAARQPHLPLKPSVLKRPPISGLV